MCATYIDGVWHGYEPGLGRVLDKSNRVQVQVLEKMTSTSTSTSTGFSKVLEYKYKYFKSTWVQVPSTLVVKINYMKCIQ